MHEWASTDIHVSNMLSDGASLAEIEHFLERELISKENRAVLWLRAWSERADDGPQPRRGT